MLEVPSLTCVRPPHLPRAFLVLRGGSPVSSLRVKPGQTIVTCQRNTSQHWLQYVARVWPPCCGLLVIVVSNLVILRQQHPTSFGLGFRSAFPYGLHRAFRMYLFVRFPLSSLHSISPLNVCTGILHIRDRYIFLQQNFYSL